MPIDNCWSSRPSTLEINRATVVASPAIHTISRAWVAQPRVSGLAFVTDHVAKMLKNARYFCL